MVCGENGTDAAIASVSGLGISSSQTHCFRGQKEKKFRWAEQQLKRKLGKKKIIC